MGVYILGTSSGIAAGSTILSLENLLRGAPEPAMVYAAGAVICAAIAVLQWLRT